MKGAVRIVASYPENEVCMDGIAFDPALQRAIADGVRELTLGQGQKVGVDHVLVGAISASPLFRQALDVAGVDVGKMIAHVKRLFPRMPSYVPTLEPDEGLRGCMQTVMQQAQNRALPYVSLGAVLLAILRRKPTSLVLDAVQAQGVHVDAIANVLEAELRQQATADEESDDIPESLRPFVIDMTDMARQGRYAPVVGRDAEIERVLVTLSQRYTPNAILVGDAGVGKTAIAEEIARRIVNDEIASMRGVRVLSVSVGGAVGGTILRGQFEQRIQDLIDFCRDHPNVVIFIDEAHMLVGAGNSVHGTDAANMLKTAMARGEMRVIMATTPGEYQATIEGDAALARRMTPIYVAEPSREVLYAIMQDQAGALAKFHDVVILPGAIDEAIRLSRFMPGRNPAAALTLLDRSAARARVAQRVDAGRMDIEQEIERALASGDIDRATRLYQQAEQGNVRPVIDGVDVVDEAAQITGIAPELLDGRPSDLIARVERELRTSIIGQEDACTAIVHALRSRVLGVSSDARPIGAFLFVGPSGVGKTETAHVLARALFGDESAVLQIDMAGLQQSYAMSFLTGAPPGYVGYDDPTPLDAIRRRPYQVVLLDEVEKAAPEVLLAFLNAFDRGYFQMTNGRSVDVRNCIFIMTSNAGTGYHQSAPIGLARDRQSEESIPKALRETFRPELLGRLNAIVPFHSLTQEHLADIARLMVQSMAKRLKDDRHADVDIRLSERAASFLASVALSPAFGARTLRVIIEAAIGPKVAEFLLSSHARSGSACVIDMAGSEDDAQNRSVASMRNVQAAIEMVKNLVAVKAAMSDTVARTGQGDGSVQSVDRRTPAR